MLYPNWIRGKTAPEVVKSAAAGGHIDHICQLAGNCRHIGIGSDLDGGFGHEQTPRDLETIADLQKLAEILTARNYSRRRHRRNLPRQLAAVLPPRPAGLKYRVEFTKYSPREAGVEPEDRSRALRGLRWINARILVEEQRSPTANRNSNPWAFPLDRTPPVGAIYRHVVIDGNLVYTSVRFRWTARRSFGKGKVPSEVSLDDAESATPPLLAANILRNVRKAVGSLDRIERVLKTVGYVNSDPTFGDQHLVINERVGAAPRRPRRRRRHRRAHRHRHGRFAVGSSVEVDVIFKLKA